MFDTFIDKNADSTCTVSSLKRQRIECVCDQPAPATKRCPLHEVVEIGDEITLPDAAIERHTLNECICYESGPAHGMCPLHEMDAFDANQVIGELNDDFLDILANLNFNDDNTPIVIVNISQPADDINDIIRNPLIQVGIQKLIAANRADIEQHNCGQLDQICPHCRAKFFKNERNARRMYNKCCAGGNVILAPFHQHSIELSDFGMDDPPEEINMMDDRIDIDEERQEANIMVNQLNEDQRNIFDMIIEAINNENEQQRLGILCFWFWWSWEIFPL
ncbi:hypothetical protein QE152_g37332 [Popillia japonica]|uniref:Uncharacterized protein n=1 Tax=Popillia japonica TaxID=7064 RepID=A0AAW1IA76_POPJA